MAYMAVFGIPPYFPEKLIKELSKVPFYGISFEESYNIVTKKEQLDVFAHYHEYDVQRSQTIGRSVFLHIKAIFDYILGAFCVRYFI